MYTSASYSSHVRTSWIDVRIAYRLVAVQISVQEDR